MYDRECPKCGTEALYGCVEDVWPEGWYSRTPITRESAQRLSGRQMVVAAKRTAGGVVTQFWRDSLGDEWTALLAHDCEGWL